MSKRIEIFPDTSQLIIPMYEDVLDDILENGHRHYKFPGGRGSSKSSFISIVIPLLLLDNPNAHAVVYRRYGNTLSKSVYPQMEWAIERLGLKDYFTFRISPPMMIFKPTGQRIMFIGLDDASKGKSMKLPFGYIAINWFEEYDQYSESEIRKTIQSTMRGGDKYWNFYSFNPPVSVSNWANEDVMIPSPKTLIVRNTYLDVPSEWLGEAFIEEAEELKRRNPIAYRNEYLGEATGSGGNVFPNTEIREITDEEIQLFDRIYRGIDWGWFPDPLHYSAMHYDAARMTLYIFDEMRANKTSNRDAWHKLQTEHGVGYSDTIIADSSEPKSIGDLRSYGAMIRGAEKGPDSVTYSMKWLQSLSKIVIDPIRCPETAKEFTHYEYEKDKNDRWVSGYPDADNHAIDSVRYATERIWKRRGQ